MTIFNLSNVILTTLSWLVVYGVIAHFTFTFQYFPDQLLKARLRLHEQTCLTKFLGPSRRHFSLILANRAVAYLHCQLMFCGGFLLFLAPSPSQSPSPVLIEGLLLMSMGYFLTDSFYIVALEYNWTFLAHHLVCLICWFIALYFNQMRLEAFTALWYAELSGLLWIPWETASKFGWVSLRKRLALPFMILFSVVRGLCLPYYLVRLLPMIWSLPISLWIRLLVMGIDLLIAYNGLGWTPKIIRKCLPDIL